MKYSDVKDEKKQQTYIYGRSREFPGRPTIVNVFSNITDKNVCVENFKNF